MTSILEKLIAIVAPHYCICCGKENNVVCTTCAVQLAGTAPVSCLFCNKPTPDFAMCPACSSQTVLRHVWAAAEYKAELQQAVRLFKFERAQAAAYDLAVLMQQILPILPSDTLVVPVPTAPSRVRQRGYDHAKLLAKALAQCHNLPYRPLVMRTSNVRQLGASRHQRIQQLQGVFVANKGCAGKNILLVDDVATTGATLAAAAEALRVAGARKIDGVVVARKV